MGIFDALNTSVAGLQAQSFALQNISGNIANAQTTAYKGTGTSFVDLVPDATTPNRQVAGRHGVCALHDFIPGPRLGVHRRHVYGDQWRGFFSVQKATGTVDNVPVFSGVTDYTGAAIFRSTPTEIWSMARAIT